MIPSVTRIAQQNYACTLQSELKIVTKMFGDSCKIEQHNGPFNITPSIMTAYLQFSIIFNSTNFSLDVFYSHSIGRGM